MHDPYFTIHFHIILGILPFNWTRYNGYTVSAKVCTPFRQTGQKSVQDFTDVHYSM